MSAQLTFQREFDLPPFWDGLAVVWDGWHLPPHAFVCPSPQRDCCAGCGSGAQPRHKRGRVAVSAIVTHQMIADADANRDRLPTSMKHKAKCRASYRLVALRCPDCGHDAVIDLEGDEWELDPTDYGPEGSAP